MSFPQSDPILELVSFPAYPNLSDLPILAHEKPSYNNIASTRLGNFDYVFCHDGMDKSIWLVRIDAKNHSAETVVKSMVIGPDDDALFVYDDELRPLAASSWKEENEVSQFCQET